MEPKSDILLVDDSPVKLLTLETVLADLNQNLVTALSGREALRKLLMQDFAVILLDVQMPELDGFETAAMIRQRPRSEHTPIIFVSAINRTESHAAKGYSLGAVDYIFTPIVPEILRAKVMVFVELDKKTREIQRQAALLREMEIREHERKLSDTAQRLKIALAAGRMGLWEWEVGGNQVIWSPPMSPGAFQYPEQNLCCGFDIFLRTVHPEDRQRFQHSMDQAVQERIDYAIEYRLIQPNGGATWVEMRGRVLADPAGTALRLVGVLVDVDERKQVEKELHRHRAQLEQLVAARTEQLRRSERLASVGTLAAGIAHEINNPLNAILLTAQYALRCGDGHETAAAFQTISEEAQRGGRIIKGILKFAKEEKTPKTWENLNDLVRHAVDLARSYVGGSAFSLTLELEENLPLLPLSTTSMEQVVVNLIKNAVEATGGDVRLLVRTFLEPGSVCLTVTDDGPGIAPEIAQHIFDPFFSTKKKAGGSGLGLSICHGIITDHGGTFELDNAVERGTTFKICLPIQDKSSREIG